MTVADAARFGEMILLAVPWHVENALPPAELLHGKIVIDAMNPYQPEGGFFDLGNSTSSEIVLQRLPGAILVKAFNTIYYEHLATRGRKDLPVQERHAIYLASDDAEAKQTVSRIIEELGFAPVDTGSLREGGRLQQPDSLIYNQTFTAREARGCFRNELHKLVDNLPDAALTRALETLSSYKTSTPQTRARPGLTALEDLRQQGEQRLREMSQRSSVRGEAGTCYGGYVGTGAQTNTGDGSFSFATAEGETTIRLTMQRYRGFTVEIVERLRFSDDKKRLVYAVSLKGPDGRETEHQEEFDI
jgi:8-hydroxy-5-deazaflavin:NADPH oxidoreductase